MATTGDSSTGTVLVRTTAGGGDASIALGARVAVGEGGGGGSAAGATGDCDAGLAMEGRGGGSGDEDIMEAEVERDSGVGLADGAGGFAAVGDAGGGFGAGEAMMSAMVSGAGLAVACADTGCASAGGEGVCCVGAGDAAAAGDLMARWRVCDTGERWIRLALLGELLLRGGSAAGFSSASKRLESAGSIVCTSKSSGRLAG